MHAQSGCEGSITLQFTKRDLPFVPMRRLVSGVRTPALILSACCLLALLLAACAITRRGDQMVRGGQNATDSTYHLQQPSNGGVPHNASESFFF